LKKPEEILIEFQNKRTSIPDKKKEVHEIIDFVNVYGDSYGSKIIPIIEDGISLSKEMGLESEEIVCYYLLAFVQGVTEGNVKSQYSTTISETLDMSKRLNKDSEWYAYGLSMLAYFHWFRGEYEKGFNVIFESLKRTETIGTLRGRPWNHFALAVFYFDTKDLENSLINYQRSLEIFTEENYEYGMARSANGLASIAILQNRVQDAIPLLEFAANIYRKFGHYSGLSRALNDMGLLEKANKNYDKAIGFLNESIHLRKEIKHKQGLITSYTELGEIYLLLKEYEPALELLLNGLELALDVNSKQKQMRLFKLLYETYKELNNTELALKNFEDFFEIRSQLLSDEAANNIKKIQTKFETEKSEKEAEIERLKNIELKSANAIIEQKNKDITDSINYAKRIQQAILPADETLQKCFDNYFVLYKPKDIVSGDFYWATDSVDRKTKSKLAIIAAVDCTGHGVPGAFMSMLANTLLNQTIVNPDVISAADVLDYLNTKLPENLKSTGTDQHIRDGMDMSLCVFDYKNMQMQFSGANNSCWIIREGQLIELKGDKQPISASNDIEKSKFTNHLVDLKKNDCVYLLTDGYADQFGGPKEKKFSYKRLKELLLSISAEKMDQQKKILDSNFETWKKDYEQIDDVCLIGIKL
jgi:serine phosphatase RsbU (regulator of sigma subunit)